MPALSYFFSLGFCLLTSRKKRSNSKRPGKFCTRTYIPTTRQKNSPYTFEKREKYIFFVQTSLLELREINNESKWKKYIDTL